MSFKEEWESNYITALTRDIPFFKRIALEILNFLVHIFFR